MKRLFDYIRPNLGRMSIQYGIKLFGTIMDLLIPWILAHIIDRITPTRDLNLVVLWGGLMVLSATVGLICNVVANRMANGVNRKITSRIRHDLFRSITYLTRAQVDRFTNPSLISRLTSDTYHVHSMLGMIQRIGVRAPILLIGGILVTFTIDPILTLVLLGVQPFIFLSVYIVTKLGLPLYQRLQEQVDRIVLVMRENITGARIIKALSKTEYERNRFDETNRELVRRETKVTSTMAFTNPLVNLYLNLGLTCVVLLGAYRVHLGQSEVGVVIAFLSYFTIILNAMYAITRIFIQATKGIASFKRIAEVLDTVPDLVVEDIAPVESPYHIEFRDVSFAYHPTRKKSEHNLIDISFQLKRGQTLGMIGPTGSGKSSIIRLLMRFYDVSTGQILIDGRDIRSIPHDELYTMFGIVFQNDVLFADTIVENIDFGRGIPDIRLRESVEMAQAGEFIHSLDDEMQHKLTIRGSNLSGGQKQRILISRALAANPEILILDDSSSALDYTTDLNLRRSLNENRKESTTIIVAQRISSIRHSDVILVMDDGRISGIGTHEELMESNPQYRRISEIQLGGIRD